jgi:hypothetical protein
MNVHCAIRRISRIAALSAGAILVPAALDAGCIESYDPVNRIETYTCCGETACCTTRWQGTTLIQNTCRPPAPAQT